MMIFGAKYVTEFGRGEEFAYWTERMSSLGQSEGVNRYYGVLVIGLSLMK
jgi:hypothetical protein